MRIWFSFLRFSFVSCFSSRRRHTRCALVTGVQTCALPIYRQTRVPAEKDGDCWDTAQKWAFLAEQTRVALLQERLRQDHPRTDCAAPAPSQVRDVPPLHSYPHRKPEHAKAARPRRPFHLP